MEPIKYLDYLSQLGLVFLFVTESILFETTNSKKPNGNQVSITDGRGHKEKTLGKIETTVVEQQLKKKLKRKEKYIQ